MSEKLIATDLWVSQAQETISQQQAEIDRLTEKRDRLLSHLKMAALAADEFWHEHYPDCIDSITSLIAEIEAGK